MTFVLDDRLASDSVLVGRMGLSEVRLNNNAAFPWLMLIPMRPNIREIIDLSVEDRKSLWAEIDLVSVVMRDIVCPDKLNIANLGNIVSQLHVHIIARFQEDKAWPHPVWNSGIHHEYNKSNKEALIDSIRTRLSL